MRKWAAIVAAVISLGFLFYAIVSGNPTTDYIIWALIIFGAVFCSLSNVGGNTSRYDGNAEAMRYKTDNATGEKIAQLKQLNENLGNDVYSRGGQSHYYSHLYDCSEAKGELINQAEMAAESLGKRSRTDGSFYAHLYGCSEADGEFIAQMEAVNEGLRELNKKENN